MQAMPIIESITLALAVLGAVLGCLNTWQAFTRDRVRLSISIRQVELMPAGVPTLCITVQNRGMQPVTITAIGMTTGKLDGQIVHPFAGNERLPHRLESRTALLWTADPAATEVAVRRKFTKVYANTACGERVTGGRRFMRSLLRHYQA